MSTETVRASAHALLLAAGYADATQPDVEPRTRTSAVDFFVKGASEVIYFQHPTVKAIYEQLLTAMESAKQETTEEEMKAYILENSTIEVTDYRGSDKGKPATMNIREAAEYSTEVISVDKYILRQTKNQETLATINEDYWNQLTSIKSWLQSLGIDSSHGQFGLWGLKDPKYWV